MRASIVGVLSVVAVVLYTGLTRQARAQATTDPSVGNTQPTVSKYAGPVRDGWWNDAVFYQVFVRSLSDSTTGPLAGDGIGDIQGLIEHLDDLNDANPQTSTDLGISAIWLMPITASPSSHGYDTTDYRTVEKTYGTNEDFKRLVGQCHQRGIRVIVDLVLNHCSDQHPWFVNAQTPGSKTRDWFIWSKNDPGYRGPWGSQVWHRRGGEYYYGLFSSQMPDLNYTHPDVTREMRATVAYWLKDMGVDGFRLDAIRHLIEDGQKQDNTPQTHQWLREFYTFYKKTKPDAFCVGEVWASTPIAASYVGDQLDSAFEFDTAGAIIGALRTGQPAPLAQQIARAYDAFPTRRMSTFLSNHDQTRFMTSIGGDWRKAKLGATLLLTLPGVPFIYYGEEIGMTGDKPDERLRTPMQWTGEPPRAGFTTGTPWIGVNLKDLSITNVQSQRADTSSLLSHYRAMIRLRQSRPALRTGDCAVLACDAPSVLAFVRTKPGEKPLLVVANFSETPTQKYTLKDQKLTPGKELTNGAKLGPPATPIQRLEPWNAYVVEMK